jgi:signal transduction histidine kinase
MLSRKPLLLDDATGDPRANQPVVAQGNIGPVLFVPVAIRDRSFGTLSLGNHPRQRTFTPDDLLLVEALATQAAVAIEHARIQEELRRLALVEDRERIAKELHDDIIQSLFAEGMALQASLGVLDDPNAMELRITQTVEHIDRVIRDLRNYIFALRPGAAADRELDRSLRDLARSFQDAAGTLIEVNTDPRAVSRLAGRAPDIIQAAREAISNAVRHSGGDVVTVSLAASGDEAILEIADNGSGFDVRAASGRGQGLGNLGARAEALAGSLEIESEPGRGTWVRITIPL